MKVKIRRWSPHHEEWQYEEFLNLKHYCRWLLDELNEHAESRGHGEKYEIVGREI